MYLLISFRFPLLHNATQPQYKTDSTIHALNTAFGYFIHTNSLHRTKRFVNFFFTKNKNFYTGKKYPIKIEIKQNQTRAYIFQNSSMNVERFRVVLSNHRACKLFTEVNRSETVWISENGFCFCSFFFHFMYQNLKHV